MALIRCESCGKPARVRQNYAHPHPATTTHRLFCGAPSCSRLATYALLSDEEEEAAYRRGERRFRVQRYRVQVEVM
jgi:hypothetical protein